MLSQQPSNLSNNDYFQRHHRRQNSTPTGFEAQGIPQHPATNSGNHRRGLSMNQQSAAHPTYPQQDGHLVSITNTGKHPQQHLQEAQQQPQARPGLQQGNFSHLQLSEQEFRNLQHQQLDAHIDSLLSNQQPQSSKPHGDHSAKIERSQSQPGGLDSMQVTMSPQAHLGMNPHLLDHYGARAVVSSPHPGECTEPDMVMHPSWMLHQRRPYTPPDQIAIHHHPLTPNASPYLAMATAPGHGEHMARAASQHNDSNATIRPKGSPVRQQSPPNVSLEQLGRSPERQGPNGTIKARQRPEYLRGHPGANLPRSPLPSPPNTAPLEHGFAPSPQMHAGMHFDLFPVSHDVYSQQNSPVRSSFPVSRNASPSRSPERSVNIHLQDVSAMFSAQAPSAGSSPNTANSSVDFGYLDSPTRLPPSPQEMSIADLSLDATIEDTGISAEEVQAYISQPDPESGKWTCLYPECGKTFGRKENVRAHVQTHLGDRQFKCIHCGKCFVRQHDLKRHSKTHSGVKPYPCRCGNSFARHDALTRHRQRGICTGGFEGVVKKMAKRGRPRKERPSHDDRADKAARTRKRAAAKSYASSVSGTSESSFPESPPLLLSGFEFEASSAQLLAGLATSPSMTLAPETLNYSFPSSPYNSDAIESPKNINSAASNQGSENINLEQHSMPEESKALKVIEPPPVLGGSNIGSQAGSPPGLSHSSPPSSTRLLDFEFGSTFNSSDSDPSIDTKHLSQIIDFEGLSFANSPDHISTPWDESNFFNFDKDTTGTFGDAFTASFDDDILFSDAHDGENHPFF